ncbi:hypothetical protein ACRALDRAFT_1068882 [Sodiomyces alcalophilus JCM 7366]|uniref:uncharacterized protein n=1 Tax=Sodiomyces alcalophilus JCM 7366 TaxID=591952 RepID=UPI0039B3C792
MGLYESQGWTGKLVRTAHFVQFVIAAVTCATFAVDVNEAKSKGLVPDPRWVYIVVITALAAATSAIYANPFIPRPACTIAWDMVLSVLWFVATGIVSVMVIEKDPAVDKDIADCTWMLLVGGIVWICEALATMFYWLNDRERRDRFTGWALV